MTILRTKLLSIAWAAGLLVSTGPLFAGEPGHDVCSVRQHACGEPARIAACCGGEPGNHETASGPVPAKIHVSPSIALVFVSADVPASLVPATSTMRVHTSPPRLALLDLPTLFATLLI